MSTTIVETPAHTMAPGAESVRALPAPVQRTFNRGFMDRSDPLEAAGTPLEPFAIALTHAVPRDKLQVVVSALYGTVYGRLRGKSIPGAEVEVVDYQDAGTGGELPRRYLVVTSETRRRTHMGVFATFRSYGDYLYVSVDAYMLPRLSVRQLLWAVLVAMGLVFFVGSFTFGIGVIFFVIPYLLWQYRDVLRHLSAGDSLGMALRRRFHAGDNLGTFNTDDVLAYFKCTVSLILEGVEEVFQAHGISVAEIERFQQSVNMTTQVINTGGVLNVMGNVVGGAGNLVKAVTGR